MPEKKIVFDFHNTLVSRPTLSREYRWMPGRPELLRELRLLGASIAIWTAGMAEAVEDTNETLVPALLGLARGGFTDEYYSADRTPPVPKSFILPYSRSDVYEYVNHIAPYSSRNPLINQVEQSIDGKIYPNDEDYRNELKKLLLQHHMRHGTKVPPLIGSGLLVDDLTGSLYQEGETLRFNARIFGFGLIDPKRKQWETKHRWIDRMVNEILSAI